MSLIGFRRSMAGLVVLMAMLVSLSESKCVFEAIFNFGDSNTDTGGFSAAFPVVPPPNGMTYFKHPAGRVSDGRLIIDFLAQAFGLPFVSPYLQSIGSDYRTGANFATQGSTAIQPTTARFDSGVSPFSLGIQLDQMKHFKALVDAHSSSEGRPSILPPPDIFGKSLYTLYIGQNDLAGTFESAGIGAVRQQNPQVVNQTIMTIKELYGIGGRTFVVLNVAPVGCFPAALVLVPHNDSDLDQFGCLISYNNAVVEYNKLLKDALSQMKQLPDANVIYVDSHAVLLELFQNPRSHGFKYGTRACCGAGGGAYNYYPGVFCGSSVDINGTTITASACPDPNNYVSWDGVHITEAANKIVTNAILSGSYFDPFFDFHQFCDIHPVC